MTSPLAESPCRITQTGLLVDFSVALLKQACWWLSLQHYSNRHVGGILCSITQTGLLEAFSAALLKQVSFSAALLKQASWWLSLQLAGREHMEVYCKKNHTDILKIDKINMQRRKEPGKWNLWLCGWRRLAQRANQPVVIYYWIGLLWTQFLH